MSGVRLERLLASTAVIVLLSGAAVGASAEPKAGSSIEAATPAPEGTAVTPPAASESDQPAAKPTGKTVTVRQIRSANRKPEIQAATLRGLGLGKIRRTRHGNRRR